MVLHNNKWDRKQNRDRVRKLKAKGKEDPAAAVTAAAAKDAKDGKVGGRCRRGKAAGGVVTPAGAKKDEEEDEEEEETESSGSEDGEDGEEENGEDGEENAHKGQFSRRKLASNSWRYEKAAAAGDNLLDPSGAHARAGGEGEEDGEEEEEVHEDYVALTLAKKGGQWVDAQEEKIRSGAVDAAFLRESWTPASTKQPLISALPMKGNIVKVDRKDFVDVTEKIAKRNNADAFRARFESSKSKAKKRAPRMAADDTGGGDGDDDGDDLDAFLGGLELDPKLAGRGKEDDDKQAAAAWSREIRPAVAPPADEVETGDEWLDQMLGGR